MAHHGHFVDKPLNALLTSAYEDGDTCPIALSAPAHGASWTFTFTLQIDRALRACSPV